MLHYIQEYLPLVESLFVILGVIFIAFQLRQQARASIADHDRQRKQSTIEFYNALSSDSQEFLDDISGKPLDLAFVNANPKLRKSVVRYLARLERLSIGIAADVYDFEILCLMSGRFLIKKHLQMKQYIHESRVAKNAPMLFMEFEILVSKIEKYRAAHLDRTVDESIRVRTP